MSTKQQTQQAMHTPGPWRLASQALGENYAVFTGGASWCIADCNAGPKNERYANARLIAATPDLLAALKTLVPLMEEYLRDAGACDHEAGICACREIAALDIASKAIAAGTGGLT